MKFLGVILFYIGAINIVLYGIDISYTSLIAILFCIGGTICFFKPPKKKPRVKNSYTRWSYDSHTPGQIIDLGSGLHFDSRDPDAILSSNWIRDGQGGYYCPGTGESIINNSGTYNYHDSDN